MTHSIGARIRGRRRSRSMNHRDYLEPVPFIENSRSLRRSARRWQPRRNDTENYQDEVEEKQSGTSTNETNMQQEQDTRSEYDNIIIEITKKVEM